ncbi:MAG: rod shape-determining protein MreC [Oscillospiraceae bacterium]|jgi:rod shape-determining protein mreC|nr:MAG: rod shape-determining protein MreC [Oscillospiraceae bacterium]
MRFSSKNGRRGGGKTNKIILSVLSAVVAVVILLLLMFNSGIDSLMRVSGYIIVPIQNACIAVGDAISGFFTGFSDNIKMQEEMRQLQAELEKLRIKDSQYDEILRENERLRDIIKESSRYTEYELLVGRVSVSGTDTYSDCYTINRGSRDGVKTDMVVVAQGGLAGRIISVSDNYCIMMSILDSRSSVPAIVERTRDTGVVKGYSTAGQVQSRCTMTYLPFELKSTTGDTVKTSGNDDVFPKGLYIGSIVEITTGSTTLGTTARIEPAVDFEHLEYVLIITGGGETDTMQDGEAQ